MGSAENELIIERILSILGPKAVSEAIQSGTYNTKPWVANVRARLKDALAASYTTPPSSTLDKTAEAFAAIQKSVAEGKGVPPEDLGKMPTVVAGGGSAVLAPGGAVTVKPMDNLGYLDPEEVNPNSPLAAMDATQDLNYQKGDEHIRRSGYVGRPRSSSYGAPSGYRHTLPKVAADLTRDEGDINFYGYREGTFEFNSYKDTLRYEEEFGGSNADIVEAVEGELQAQEEIEGYDRFMDDPNGSRRTMDRTREGVASLRTSRPKPIE